MLPTYGTRCLCSATVALVPPQTADFKEKNDAFIVPSSQDVLVESSSVRKQVNQVDSGLQPYEIERGDKIVATSAESFAAVKFSSEEATKSRNQNQSENLEQSTSKTSELVGVGHVNNFRTQETQKVAELKPGFSTASSLSSELRISSKSGESPSSTPFSGVQRKPFDSSNRNSSGSNEGRG